MHKNFRKNRKTVRQILNHHFDRFGKCDRIKTLASHLKMPTLFFEKKDEEKTMIPERLAALREKMRAYGVDAYLVPTADYHESEYVGTYFKARTYITGFTGSAGTAVITQDEACLWTDGRYFVQAAKELAGTGVTLMKMGQEGVPTVEEYLAANTKEGMTIGFDGRVVNEMLGEALEKTLPERFLSYRSDLIGEIWSDRPALSAEPVWILDAKYTGESAAERLAKVREKMKENGAEVHILTALDDIAWMLNIRGNDIPCNPVVLSYLVLTETESHLFIQEETLNEKVKQYLANLGISLHPYDAVYDFVSGITGKTILLEKAKVNYTICPSVMGSTTIANVMNPASSLKAVKTPVEMENIRKAHIKDGVAVTRFVYWLKKNIGKIPMDEVSVAEKLESFRKEQEGFIEPSFGTISAYGPNAAMCHYQATKDNFSVLQPKGMYLVDSGGQYYEGTTDITRTIVVGPLTEKEKEHFTITAMGTLRLGNAKFLHGCIGINLDYLARQAFWERGLDFNHGTGHGVGYLLNVHERPNGFRWKMVPERMENAVLEEGMLTSDEPGIYIEGSHGIRTENLMLCRKAEKNMYGQFMRFEFVTMVPIDLDGIDTQYMTEKDVELLNNYHKEVYEKISPYLEGDEKEWLKEATRPISK